jgi:hypothetical protein
MAGFAEWWIRARDLAPDIHRHLTETVTRLLTAGKLTADGLLALAEALDEAGWFSEMDAEHAIARQYGALAALVREQVPVRALDPEVV